MENEKDFVNRKFKEIQKEKEQEAKNNKKKTNKKKIALIALILAGVAALSTLIGVLVSKISKKDKEDVYEKPQDEVSDFLEDEILEESQVMLDNLGVELEVPTVSEDKKEFGEVIEGDIDPDKIVTDENGTNWVDEEAYENKDEVGKEVIDDQSGTLEVDKDGDVVEKQPEAEIEKEDGTIVTIPEEDNTNENNKPGSEVPGYEYYEELDKVVDEEDANKFVYVDANYYDMNGNLVYAKGEIVLKETLEKIKNDQNLTTTKPEVSEPEVSTPEVSEPEVSTPEVSEPEEDDTNDIVDSYGGVVNEDGTYTITYEIEGEKYSITYMDKVTYECWLLDEKAEENYGYYNGIIYPVSVIEEMYQNKVNLK